jgi:quercetin dioxygenase-like cupin family protein
VGVAFAVLGAAAAAPAGAQVRTADPPARVAPDGSVEVQFLVGPHAGLGRSKVASDGCAVDRLVIQPGGAVPEHVHQDADEIVIFVKGAGTFTLEGKASHVAAGGTVLVPKGKKHAFKADAGGVTEAIQVYDAAGPEGRFLAWPQKGRKPGGEAGK